MTRMHPNGFILICVSALFSPLYAQNNSTDKQVQKTWKTHYNGRKPVYSNPDLQSNITHVPPDPERFDWFITNRFDGKVKLSEEIGVFILDPATNTLRYARDFPENTKVFVSALRPVSGMNFFGFKLEEDAKDTPIYWISGAFLRKERKGTTPKSETTTNPE